MSTVAPSQPPTRQIRLLATVGPVAAVVFALITVWLVVSTVRGVGQLLGGVAGSGEPVLAVAVLVVLGAAAAVVTALVAYRLGVQVPRILRGWDDALVERARTLRGE